MPSFWVYNRSKFNVTLGDLGISIRSGAKVDLLARGYNLKLDQLKKSIQAGSLYKKRDKIIPCGFPHPAKPPPIQVSTLPLELRSRTAIVAPKESYLDLPGLTEDDKSSDEKYLRELIEEEFEFK